MKFWHFSIQFSINFIEPGKSGDGSAAPFPHTGKPLPQQERPMDTQDGRNQDDRAGKCRGPEWEKRDTENLPETDPRTRQETI
jgi:hypothetical protein